jgi:hypothetical protein
MHNSQPFSECKFVLSLDVNEFVLSVDVNEFDFSVDVNNTLDNQRARAAMGGASSSARYKSGRGYRSSTNQHRTTRPVPNQSDESSWA